jgi:hypothetical protein
VDDSVISQLAEHLARVQPDWRGFSRRKLQRMRQFYECYCDRGISLSTLAELPCTARFHFTCAAPSRFFSATTSARAGCSGSRPRPLHARCSPPARPHGEPCRDAMVWWWRGRPLARRCRPPAATRPPRRRQLGGVCLRDLRRIPPARRWRARHGLPRIWG